MLLSVPEHFQPYILHTCPAIPLLQIAARCGSRSMLDSLLQLF